jgi:hypothetical protein
MYCVRRSGWNTVNRVSSATPPDAGDRVERIDAISSFDSGVRNAEHLLEYSANLRGVRDLSLPLFLLFF